MHFEATNHLGSVSYIYVDSKSAKETKYHLLAVPIPD